MALPSDSCKPALVERAYRFAINGGGTITYRMIAIAGLAIIGFFGKASLDRLDSVVKAQWEMAGDVKAIHVTVDSHTQQFRDYREGQQRIWEYIRSDHDQIIQSKARIDGLSDRYDVVPKRPR